METQQAIPVARDSDDLTVTRPVLIHTMRCHRDCKQLLSTVDVLLHGHDCTVHAQRLS